jgi:hypothetical protein
LEVGAFTAVIYFITLKSGSCLLGRLPTSAELTTAAPFAHRHLGQSIQELWTDL